MIIQFKKFQININGKSSINSQGKVPASILMTTLRIIIQEICEDSFCINVTLFTYIMTHCLIPGFYVS